MASLTDEDVHDFRNQKESNNNQRCFRVSGSKETNKEKKVCGLNWIDQYENVLSVQPA